MKYAALTIVSLILVFAFSVGVNAETSAIDAAEELYGSLDENGAAAAEAAENGSGFDFNSGISKVISIWAENFGPVLSKSIASAAKLLAVSLLASAAASAFPENANSSFAMNACASAAVIIAGTVELNSALAAAVDLQNRLSSFSKVLFPVLTAAGAASGAGGEALMRQSGTALFSDLMVTAYSKLLIPFVMGYVGLRLAGSASENPFFQKFADWLKNLATGGMKIFLMLFVGYVTISGAAGRAADSLAVRSAKTAAASVPYIGGVIAEAADAVFAGASVIKGYIGVFGAVAVLGSAILPVLSCGLGWGCVKLAAMFSLSLPAKCGQSAIETVAEAMGLVFAMTAASTALMLLSVIVCMNTAGAA